MSDIACIAAVAGFLILSGFYSGVETGVYVMNVVRVRLLSMRGNRRARLLVRLLDHPELLLSTLLVGTNVCTFCIASFATTIVEGRLHGLNAFYIAVITTLVLEPFILVFAEMLPKNLYRRRPNKLVAASTGVLKISWLLFLPVTIILAGISRAVGFLAGRRPADRGKFWTLRSIQQNLTEGAAHGAISTRQNFIATNILGLGHVKVRSVMTPLSKTVLVSEDAVFADCFKTAESVRFSRYPVYRGKKTEIVGVVNIFDPLFTDVSGDSSMTDEPVKPHVKPHITVRDDAEVDEALAALRKAQSPMGIVTDASGLAVGIVTMKDVVEEIIGEVPVW